MSDEQYTLPEGWALAKIEDVVQPVRQFNPAATPQAIYRYVDVSSISNRSFEIEAPKIVAGAEAPTRARQAICPGDILFSTVRPYLRNVAVVRKEDEGNVGSTAFCVLRSNGSVDPGYLFRWTVTDEFFEALIPKQRGISYPAVRDADVLGQKIPIAPLAEQRRIVAKIEALFEQSRTARQALDRIPPLLKKFRQSVLAAAFRGDLTRDWREQNRHAEPAQRSVASLIGALPRVKTRRDVPASVERPEEFERIELPSTWTIESTAALLRAGALIDVKDGNHGSNHPKRNEFSDTGLAFITAAQVRNYQIDYISSPKVAGEALKRLRVGFANVGDVILTHKGTVGRAAINTEPCVLTPQTTYYRCNREVIDPQYLVYYLTSAHFFRQLAAVMSQTTRDFVPISEQYRLFMIVPPLTEQEEIIHRLTMMFTLADATEVAVEAARRRADKVDQSILARAFHGELVPQDPNDEPASILHGRIHSERSTGTPSRRLAGYQERKRKRGGKKADV